jgi:tRNA threonylcarbamoyladenosine biosynthesis protein TsaB
MRRVGAASGLIHVPAAFPTPAVLLAIDSSTERLCLAAQAGSRTWTDQSEGGAMASSQLLPRALAGLQALGLAVAQLDAIAFSRGPGAFTGLRTACAVAQGLALGVGKPVLALDSLLLLAEDACEQAGRPEGFEAWVAMDARMEEAYAAAYRWDASDDHWQVQQAPALYTLPALAEAWSRQPPAAVAGNALAAFGDRLPAGDARVFAQEQDRSAALLRLAQGAWRRGEAFDAADALPLYLRDKVALTTAEREAKR